MQQLCPSLTAQSESVEQPFSQEPAHTPPQQTWPPEQLVSAVQRMGHAAVAVQMPEAAQQVGVAARPAQSLSEEHGGKQSHGTEQTFCFEAGFD